MTKPDVIFNCRYTYSLNHIDNKFNKTKEKKILKKVNLMFDYYSNEQKRAMSMFDYYTGNINKDKTMNLVIENGEYATKDIIEKRKKQYAKYIKVSNLWQGVLSFNNDYIDSHIELKELEQRIIKQVLPKFLLECGFKDIKNMSYQIALHTDTDNYHFHISFIEKKPNYISKLNSIQYRRKGKINQHEIDFMKNQTLLAIEREKEFRPLTIEVNKDIEELKKYFKYNTKNFLLKDKENLILESNILRLGQLLNDKRNSRIKYNSINDPEIKNLTENIKKYVLDKKNKDFQNDYRNFYYQLNNLNDYFNKLNKRNNIKEKMNVKYILSKQEYLDNYIYNAIVNYSKKYYDYKSKYTKKIKAEDIIQEIVLKDYIKNKKQTKFNILKNYLVNTTNESKYQNTYKIKNAIKKINDEMTEAEQEFSKMFQQKEYDKN